jgi:HK97 family phage major capsid protein
VLPQAAESTVNFEDAEKSDLIAKTLTAYDGISRELDEDSLVALEPFFAEVFGDAIAQEENKQLLVGKDRRRRRIGPLQGHR